MDILKKQKNTVSKFGAVLLLKQSLKVFLGIGVLVAFVSCTWDDGYADGEKIINEKLLPVVEFSTPKTELIEFDTISFSNLTLNDPTLYTWEFEGGKVIGTTGNIGTEENALVTYPFPGTFYVSLSARNTEGVSTIIKEDYITVKGTPVPYVSRYSFLGNLEDEGLNNITAVSSLGPVTYGEDRNGIEESAWITPGLIGQQLTIPNYYGVEGSGSRTLMAWVKISDVNTGNRHIIEMGSGNNTGELFTLGIYNNSLRTQLGRANITSGTIQSLRDGNWHHVAVSYESDPTKGGGPEGFNCKFYFDGGLVQNNLGGSWQNQTVVNTVISKIVKIGASEFWGTAAIIGSIDDVRIVDNALGQSQIVAVIEGTDEL